MVREKKHIFLRSALQILAITTVFVVIVLALYHNSLNGPFIFDDIPNILENHPLRLQSLSFKDLYDAGFHNLISNKRPVAYITFALNYYFGHYDTTGYHVFNIFVHIMNGILLFLLFRTTLIIVHSSPDKSIMGQIIPRSSLAPETQASLIAFSAALLWLVHPLHTQSVAYIVQRMNSMAALFYLLAFFLYIQGRLSPVKIWRIFFFVGCFLSGILALGSKQIAVTLPLFLFLYEWFFFQNLDRRWLKKRIVPILCVAFFLFFAALLFLGTDPLDKIINGYRNRDFSLLQRVMTEWRVVILYISLLFFPHPSRLTLDYDLPLSHSLFNTPTTIMSLLGIIGLLVLAILLLVKRERLVSFCILWFLGNLLLESSVVGLELVYEHRTYLPSMMIIFALVYLALRYIQIRWVVTALLCIAVVLFSIWTYQRSALWSDDLLLWQNNAEKSPNKARVRNNLGRAYASRELFDKAEYEYLLTIDLDPEYYQAYNNLGNVYSLQKEFDNAIETYRNGLAVAPRFALLWYNLGNAYNEQGFSEEAFDYYTKALSLGPTADIHFELGNSYSEKGMFDRAISEYRAAVGIDPDYANAYHNLGNVFYRMNRLDDAEQAFKRAITIKPGSVESLDALGVIYFLQGQPQQAIHLYTEAIQMHPDNAQLHFNLGNVYFDSMEFEKAIEEYEKAIRMEPQNIDAHFKLAKSFEAISLPEQALEEYGAVLAIAPDNLETLVSLASLCSRIGRLEDAVETYRKAQKLYPDNAMIHYNLGYVYQQNDMRDEALREYAQSIQHDPNNYGAYLRIADIYEKSGEEEKSIDIYKKLIDVSPPNAMYHYKLANTYHKLKRFDDALVEYLKTLDLNPEHKGALNNIAIIYMDRGNVSESIGYLTRKITIDPEGIDAYYNMACIYSKENNIQESVEWMKKAIEKGLRDIDLLERDPDLQNLRESHLYDEIVNTIKNAD